jgi:hypothetical protein
MFPLMVQGNLFPEPQLTVPDEEAVETLRAAIARAGRLPRSADLLLCGLCAHDGVPSAACGSADRFSKAQNNPVGSKEFRIPL